MEMAKDLNMESDEMQLVVSALRGVKKRIVEVAETHKPIFSGELFLTGKEVCERLYISPRTLQDYRDRKIIPYTQIAGKILYKASDLEKRISFKRHSNIIQTNHYYSNKIIQPFKVYDNDRRRFITHQAIPHCGVS